MHINFGGSLNNLQVKNHDLAMYVVSSWTATMNKTESTQPAIFPKVLLKLAPFHVIVLTLCLQPASPAQLLSQVTACTLWFVYFYGKRGTKQTNPSRTRP